MEFLPSPIWGAEIQRSDECDKESDFLNVVSKRLNFVY